MSLHGAGKDRSGRSRHEEEQASLFDGPHGPATRGSAHGTRTSGKPPFFDGKERALPGRGPKQDEREKDVSAPPSKNLKSIESSSGTVQVENYYEARELEKLAVDDGICMFSRNNPGRQRTALVNVSRSDGGNVTAAVKDGVLVGFIGVHRPSDRERWGKPGYPWLYELGAIEVSRNYRRIGLAEALLEVAFDDLFYDDKIIFTTGFTWHWDLEKTGMTKMQYHDLGVRLMGRYGFMEMATDEPNIAMDSANLFMARIGVKASDSRYQEFSELLFSNEWEAMLRGY